jgi:hypothetical protein
MFFALWLLLLLCPIALAQEAQNQPLAYQEVVLDNGLKVVSLEDFSCPIVAVQVWYHVGSKNEEPDRQGFAHMFEHMMFRGTDRLNETGHFDNIRKVGGNCNAYTSFDQTVYVNEVPSNQLELVLWLEAERMAFLKIDEKGFHTTVAISESNRAPAGCSNPSSVEQKTPTTKAPRQQNRPPTESLIDPVPKPVLFAQMTFQKNLPSPDLSIQSPSRKSPKRNSATA